jgi:preprotein translocase subunit SecA
VAGLEKSILLERLDHHWKEHSPRWTRCGRWCSCAYAQKTPINEYKQEAFGLFEKMLDAIREDVTRILMTSEIRMRPADDFQLPELPDFRPATSIRSPARMTRCRCRAPRCWARWAGRKRASPRCPVGTEDPFAGQGVSRNAPCPCGSGQKYKHCHGAAV